MPAPLRRSTLAGAPSRLASLLKRPAVVIAEVCAIALAGVIVAVVPQEPAGSEIARFRERWPAFASLAEALGLHAVTSSPWFVGLAVLALVSLVLVQRDQWSRVVRTLRATATADHALLTRAQFRAEVPLAAIRVIPSTSVRTSTGRLGVLGSPIFHLGLVLVVAAALWRSLVFSEALVRLYEGATLEGHPGAWDAQRGGPASAPIALAVPVRLLEVRPSWYGSGALEQLAARVSLGGGAAASERELAINAALDLGDERVYVTQRWGVAALLEIEAGGRVDRATAWLEGAGELARGTVALPGGEEARLKARLDDRSGVLEVRIARDRTLLGLATLGPGGEVRAPSALVRLVAAPRWIQLRGSRDPTEPLFLVGVAAGILGIVMMVTLVRVDTLVAVEGDKVVLALAAQRFAPLYAERFERLRKEWTT